MVGLRFGMAIATLALIVSLCPTVEAGPPTDALRDVFAEANKIIHGHGADSEAVDPLLTIRALLGALFQFRDVAEFTLGPEWQARTTEERDEFIQLFTDLLQLSYVQMVAAVAYANAGVRVRYLGESIDDNTALVRTAIVNKKKGNVMLDYEMARRDDRWTVRDVLIEGVSLSANYRAQFQRIMRESSYAELVSRIKTRTADWARLTAMAAELNGGGMRMARARSADALSALVTSYWLLNGSSQAP
jgi:phospholipid transport system substrate-binding protein